MPNLLILANKKYKTDFRKYLMRAAERAGARALHIYCWEEVMLSRNGGEYVWFPPDIDEGEILRLIAEYLGPGPMIVLTGLGCNESPIATRLQHALPNAIFVYDVYDDLMFNATGPELAARSLRDGVWRERCSHTIVLDAELGSRYPGAHHLDNASHLRFLPAVWKADPDRAVYVGSIDSRVDFDWLDALMAHGLSLDIYGAIHSEAPEVAPRLERFLARNPKAAFHGAYDNDDLWSILGRYRVGALPYQADHPMTRHVNPDKLYHYLNAGLEVLAAPIPQAARHARHVHLIPADGDWEKAISDVKNRPRRGDWPAAAYSWDARWKELVGFLADGKGRPGKDSADDRLGSCL